MTIIFGPNSFLSGRAASQDPVRKNLQISFYQLCQKKSMLQSSTKSSMRYQVKTQRKWVKLRGRKISFLSYWSFGPYNLKSFRIEANQFRRLPRDNGTEQAEQWQGTTSQPQKLAVTRIIYFLTTTELAVLPDPQCFPSAA